MIRSMLDLVSVFRSRMTSVAPINVVGIIRWRHLTTSVNTSTTGTGRGDGGALAGRATG